MPRSELAHYSLLSCSTDGQTIKNHPQLSGDQRVIEFHEEKSASSGIAYSVRVANCSVDMNVRRQVLNRPSSRSLANLGYAFFLLSVALLYVHDNLVTDPFRQLEIDSLSLITLMIAMAVLLVAVYDRHLHGRLGWRRGLSDLPIDDPSHRFCWHCGTEVSNEFCNVCGAKVRS